MGMDMVASWGTRTDVGIGLEGVGDESSDAHRGGGGLPERG